MYIDKAVQPESCNFSVSVGVKISTVHKCLPGNQAPSVGVWINKHGIQVPTGSQAPSVGVSINKQPTGQPSSF